ncbi:MAG TPA: O-antigen ligase family protein [Solirubrobacteraceae bacterium]|nr:O-antigen ligase family protein [Solirubrobacteraceae bacterium]
MSTAESLHSRDLLGPGGDRLTRIRSAVRTTSAATVLLSVLLLVLLYAAFDHGAASVAAGARIQAVVAAIAAVASGGVLWTGTLRFAAPRVAVVGLGLLAAFACWSGITVAWSVAPDQTWLELNRAITYVLVLALGVVVGASRRRSIELAAKGFLAIGLALAVYGIGQKVLPGIHISGVFTLNQTTLFPRLQAPFGYWNALALFIAMAIPIALAITVDKAQRRRVRLSALVSVELLLVTLAFTESRGGMLAAAIGLAVGIGLSGARLRSLMWFALALSMALPPLVIALSSHNLNTALISLSAREQTGAELGAVLLASLVVSWLVGSRVINVEARTRLGPERGRRVGRLLIVLAAVALACGVLAVGLSSRGLTGSISHAWDSFTSTKSATSAFNPDRLLSVDSENRWVWWKEALGAFSDRPIGGWGAGSFPVVHLLYRHNPLPVTEAHSVPLQFLAETGVIGALLALGAYGLLLWSGISTVRRRLGGRERALGAALAAAGVVYAVHACYDWDWDIPGVTLPAMMLLGVLAGRAGRRRPGLRAIPMPASGQAMRLFGLVACTLLLCAVAISGVTPSLAAGRSREAVLSAARGTPAALASAQSSAELASRLDPLSDGGLLAEADVAFARREFALARSDVIGAIGREPDDLQAWIQLLGYEEALGDIPAVRAVGDRILALDPEGAQSRGLAVQSRLFAIGTGGSATAIKTPGG